MLNYKGNVYISMSRHNTQLLIGDMASSGVALTSDESRDAKVCYKEWWGCTESAELHEVAASSEARHGAQW